MAGDGVGPEVNVGAVESFTVTLNDAEDELPAWSVAVHVTVVVPMENVDPDVGEQVAFTGPLMLSVAGRR